MANNPQARKRARQTERHTEKNRSRISRMRSFVKKVEQAIEGKSKDEALAALQAAQPEIMRGATKRVLHQKTAARKISRLHKRINALA